MRKKEEEQREARRLRAKGWSLRRIARELDVALSSVSTWVRNVPRSPSRKEAGQAGVADEHPEEGVLFSLGDLETTEVTLRYCSKCAEWLPTTAFNRHGHGHQWWCRECFRAYFRNRGDLHREQSGAARQRRRLEAREYVVRLLGSSSCADCGVNDPMVFEFDHLGEKLGDISKLRRDGLRIDRLRKEIAGCEIVCVNCHRHRTARRCNSWRLDLSRLSSRAKCEQRNYEHVYGVLRGSECVDCGCSDLVVLEFDHVGVKTANVLELARSGVSLARLEAEIAQCEIRCGNCHRRKTIQRFRERVGRYPRLESNQRRAD